MEGDDDEPRRELSPVPFVVALVIVVVLAVVGFVYLRPDDAGELVRPERLEAVDADTIRATATLPTPCDEVLRAQVDLAEEAIFVELVVDRADGPCTLQVQPVEADITLPAAIDGRELRPGVGRFRIPCRGEAPRVTCAAGR